MRSPIDWQELPAVVDAVKAHRAGRAAASSGSAEQHHLRLGDRRRAPTVDAAFAKAKHVTKIDIRNNRLVPNAIEPRAALGVYDPAEEHYTLYTTSQNPHVARLVLSAFYNVAPEHKLRVIAPDVGGGFGSKIFIYPEEIVCLWASKKSGVPVKWVADRTESFLPTRMAATTSRMPRWPSTPTTRSSASRSTRSPISAATCRSSRRACRPISTRRCSPASTRSRRSTRTSARSIPTPSPVDAYRGAGRPEATFVVERIVETAARELGVSPAELRRKNFVTSFPHQTPVIMAYDAGDYAASLDAAMKASDYAGYRQAQGGSREARQAARHRHELLHRGVRHRAVARRSARSAPASACGNRPKCASIRSARSKC